MDFGHFDDATRSFVITDPLPPRPWINYLGNRRLSAFISQQAGGLLWHLQPHSGRISRYHYLAAPGDRPGFYVYVLDRRTGKLWNPHFAPACEKLDAFQCRHEPGLTSFEGVRDGAKVRVTYAIPPGDDAMVWSVEVANVGDRDLDLLLASYLEFGLLEFLRESIGWCYLKNHFGLFWDAAKRAIRYDYHVFEAEHCPRMVFGCSEEPAGFDCSREAFIGRAGSLQRPAALSEGKLTGSELPMGGHGCGSIGVDVKLAPGQSRRLAYVFALAADWEGTDALLSRYATPDAADAAVAAVRQFWTERLGRFQVATGDAAADRFCNTWNPYNAMIALELARTISTDHMGTDGLRYRDTTQDALAAAHVDPDFALERMGQVFEQQTPDGGGCFAFFPHTHKPTTDSPHRSDNGVWQIYTIHHLLAETGDFELLDRKAPFRGGGEASYYEHTLLGLKHIHDRRGPAGLPLLFDVDWNDSLAMFADPKAQSVMLGMQMVFSCRLMSDLARRLGRDDDAAWTRSAAEELSAALNSGNVWDGRWYRRLLLSNDKMLGSSAMRQGSIYLNPQAWSVISGVGDLDGRGRAAMDAAAQKLDTEAGLRICAPPFRGFPEPEDPPLGSNPGVGENGSIFCHANTWAIIAECILGRAEKAWKYYRQLLPESVIARFGAEHYQREPYVYVSSIVGPDSDRFGEAGISWLTGTASWMYVAATQFLIGVRPTLDGLLVAPCLPASLPTVRVTRLWRGCRHEIQIANARTGKLRVECDGHEVPNALLPPPAAGQTSRRVTVTT